MKKLDIHALMQPALDGSGGQPAVLDVPFQDVSALPARELTKRWGYSWREVRDGMRDAVGQLNRWQHSDVEEGVKRSCAAALAILRTKDMRDLKERGTPDFSDMVNGVLRLALFGFLPLVEGHNGKVYVPKDAAELNDRLASARKNIEAHAEVMLREEDSATKEAATKIVMNVYDQLVAKAQQAIFAPSRGASLPGH